MNKKLYKWLMWIILITSALVAVSLFSLSVGSASIPINKIPGILTGSKTATEYSILFHIRLPRIILGLAIGGALSLAGAILQGIFRNPLVEPYTLGISGGAALGVSLHILLKLANFTGPAGYPLAGSAGSALVIILLYSLSTKRGILRMQGLLLTGVMISFISSSLIMLIMAVSRLENLHSIVFWIMGSLEEPSWTLIRIMLIISTVGLAASYFYQKDLNALILGDEEALHLGVNVESAKRNLLILACVLTGSSVSLAGIIGFVGLVVPHVTRMFIGKDHRVLLIASYLLGGTFLVLCDTLARTIIAPMELPVGVITGILGGGLFVYALTKKKVSAGSVS
ncbi:MAG: iron ABC transporter permease [Candidatus Omnitrophota bacterium]